jgi:signal transduction histidine kinase
VVVSVKIRNWNEKNMPVSQKNSTDEIVPPILHYMQVAFTVTTYLTLIISTGVIVSRIGFNTPLLVILPACYILVHIAFHKIYFVDGKLEILPWWKIYRSEYLGRRIGFLLVGFVLTFMLCSLHGGYTGMYFVLMGQTMGMLKLRWALGLVSIELLTLFVQQGAFGNLGILWETYWWFIAIVTPCALITSAAIVALITSHIRSVGLVEELQATRERLEVALAHEAELAVLRERHRVAREMHDVLGHSLILMKLKLETIGKLLQSNPSRAAAEIATSQELLRQSMTDLRASLADLQSDNPGVTDKPVSQDLQEWAGWAAGEARFVVTCNIPPEVERLPLLHRETVRRIGREAVLNVLKHARAQNVTLKISLSETFLDMTIADDGVGLADCAALNKEGHNGVRGMRERVEMLGGTLTLQPNPGGRGLLLQAHLPLPVTETPVLFQPPKIGLPFGLFKPKKPAQSIFGD